MGEGEGAYASAQYYIDLTNVTHHKVIDWRLLVRTTVMSHLLHYGKFRLSIFRCVRISIRGLVRRSVGRSVGPLVGWSVMLLSKSMKNGFLGILNDLDSAG